MYEDLKLISDEALDRFIGDCLDRYRISKKRGGKKTKLIELKLKLACKEWQKRHPETLPPSLAGHGVPKGYKIYKP